MKGFFSALCCTCINLEDISTIMFMGLVEEQEMIIENNLPIGGRFKVHDVSTGCDTHFTERITCIFMI